MKWFRHISDASDDEFIAELEELFGWEGYGRWWKLLEVIAKQMDASDKCSAEYSWSKWQTFLKGKRNKLETFLVHLQNKQKINLEQTGNILRISCPKLLDLRDEYSRKSGQTPDKCPDKVAPEEYREEEKKEREEDSLRSSSLKTKAKKSDSSMPGFDEFWKLYPPNGASKADALKSYRKAITNGADHDAITRALPAYQRYTAAAGISIAHATTWLNQQRWTVDYDAIAQPGNGAGSGARPHGVQVQTGGAGTPILRADHRDPATRARDEGQRIIAKRRAERESAAGRSGGAGPTDITALAGLCQPEHLRGQGGDDGIPRPDVPASAGVLPDLTGERGIH